MPVKLNKRVQIPVLLQLREIGIVLSLRVPRTSSGASGQMTVTGPASKRKMCFNERSSAWNRRNNRDSSLGTGPAPPASVDLRV